MCRIRPPYSRNGKSRPTCGLTCARVLEYAVNSNKSPRGTAGFRPPPPLPPPPTHAHTIPVYDNAPQINVHLASFLAGLSLASSNRPAAGSSPSRHFPGGHGSTSRRTQPNTMFQGDESSANTVPAPAPFVATDPCVVGLLVVSRLIIIEF